MQSAGGNCLALADSSSLLAPPWPFASSCHCVIHHPCAVMFCFICLRRIGLAEWERITSSRRLLISATELGVPLFVLLLTYHFRHGYVVLQRNLLFMRLRVCTRGSRCQNQLRLARAQPSGRSRLCVCRGNCFCCLTSVPQRVHEIVSTVFQSPAP